MTLPPMQTAQACQDLADLRAHAAKRAGGPDDLARRAQLYLDIYDHSGGRHAFALLAAHGALWGAKHFGRGLAIAQVLSLGHRNRQAKLDRLAAYARAIQDINTGVCIETYATYHLTRHYGAQTAIAAEITPALAHALAACHAARTNHQPLADEAKKALYTAFFAWEQDRNVHTSITQARAALDWPMMDQITMRPPVHFAYFPAFTWLSFSKFHDKDERIEKGMRAFQISQSQGWTHVEATARAQNAAMTLPAKGKSKPNWQSPLPA